MSDSVKSRAVTAFLRDLEEYTKETKKDAKQALADKALDVAIKIRNRAKKAAPSTVPDGTSFAGYNVIVRPKIVKSMGARYSATETDYSGRVGRIGRGVNKGKVRINKRAAAVKKELAMRKSSVKFISVTIPTWVKSRGQVPDGVARVLLGESFTKGRRSKLGDSKAEYKENSASIKIEARPKEGPKSANLRKILTKIEVGGLNDSRLDTRRYVSERNGRRVGRNIKRSYRAQ